MARSKTQKYLSASILAGSEEMFDFFCEPCSSEQHLEAAGYCQQCSQYLCITCIKVHSKLAATSHHTVLDKSAMPKTKIQPNVQSTDILTEKCRKHPDKVLEYFCKTHDEICCSVCVTLDHGSCNDKTYVPDISSSIANSKEHTNLRADLDRLVGLLTKRQEYLNYDSKSNEKCYTKALDDIKEFRKQINELLDKIEEDTKQNINKIHQENINNIKSEYQACQPLLSEVKAMTLNMETTSRAGKSNQLFVQVKLFRRRIADVEKKMIVRNKITKYALAQDEKFHQLISTISSIGTLPVRKEDTPVSVRYIRQIDMKARVDTKKCKITAITVLTTDRIVITDFRNNAIKLYDTKVNKLLSRLAVSSGPADSTVIKPNQVAVTLPVDMEISILTVSDTLSTSHTIETHDAAVLGLCYDGSNFIAACCEPASVKIIDMSGTTVKTFSTDVKGVQLFKTPLKIALSRDNDIFYVTDGDSHTVTSMTFEGHVIWTYRHDKLKDTAGVAVGKDGTVYVCGEISDTVHQLTPSGDLMRIILGPDQGKGEKPVTIAYCEKKEILYISNADKNRDYIRLYQLE